MVAEHFTVIPCEPYTDYKVQGTSYICSICPCANDTLYARFKDVRIILYFFYERW